tara:strand:+ start:717 stop:1397 length:681 start_codon:yes stop_codon:yes gene_type:complete
MSKTQIPTNGIADDAVGNTKLDLGANYAFTGTISGTGGAYEVVSSSTSSSTVYFEISGLDNGNRHFFATASVEPLADSDSNHLMFQYGNSGGYVDFGHSVCTHIFTKYDGSSKNLDFSSNTDDGSKLQITKDALGSDSYHTNQSRALAYIYMFNPNEANFRKYAGGHCDYVPQGYNTSNSTNATHANRSQFVGVYDSTTQFTKFRMFLNSGSAMKGTVTLYGDLTS